MSQQRASLPSARNRRILSSLPRAFLLPVWAAWTAGVGLSLGLFVIGLPARFHQLVALSSQTVPALHPMVPGPLRAILAPNVYP
jgi:hypothetical protein